jgi:hypothetical protein
LGYPGEASQFAMSLVATTSNSLVSAAATSVRTVSVLI